MSHPREKCIPAGPYAHIGQHPNGPVSIPCIPNLVRLWLAVTIVRKAALVSEKLDDEISATFTLRVGLVQCLCTLYRDFKYPGLKFK